MGFTAPRGKKKRSRERSAVRYVSPGPARRSGENLFVFFLIFTWGPRPVGILERRNPFFFLALASDFGKRGGFRLGGWRVGPFCVFCGERSTRKKRVETIFYSE